MLFKKKKKENNNLNDGFIKFEPLKPLNPSDPDDARILREYCKMNFFSDLKLNIRDFFLDLPGKILNLLLAFLAFILTVLKEILRAVIEVIIPITSLLFVIGIVLLIYSVYEWIHNSIPINQHGYFDMMIFFIVLHIIIAALYFIFDYFD